MGGISRRRAADSVVCFDDTVFTLMAVPLLRRLHMLVAPQTSNWPCCSGYACRALGRLAVFPAWLAIGSHAAPQHVHA